MKITVDTAVLLGIAANPMRPTWAQPRGKISGISTSVSPHAAAGRRQHCQFRQCRAGDDPAVHLRLGLVLDEQNIPEVGRWS